MSILIYEKPNMHTVTVKGSDQLAEQIKNESPEDYRNYQESGTGITISSDKDGKPIPLQKQFRITFYPGKNVINTKLFKEFKKEHAKLFDWMVDQGHLRVFSEEESRVDVNTLSTERAKLLIDNTMFEEELKQMINQETSNKNRKDVIERAKKQLSELEKVLTRKNNPENSL